MSLDRFPPAPRHSSRAVVHVISALLGLNALLAFPGFLRADTKLQLQESDSPSRAYQVETRVELDGKLQTSAGGGKAVSLPLKGTARFGFYSRPLPAAGRNEKALRSLRWYSKAVADIEVSGQTMSTRLGPARSLLVAGGDRTGVVLYSPSEPLTYSELELLRTPADPLAALSILPPADVSIGQTWELASWAAQMLSGLDVVLKHEVTGELVSVREQTAEIRLKGKVEGATLGASTTVSFEGAFRFDLAERCLTHGELEQTEERSVGTVSPGMNVTAKVTWDRKPVALPRELRGPSPESLPLDAPADRLLLRFESPWNLSFLHGRHWHLFYRNREVAVLRLLDRGSLIAQCNISPIPSVAAGEHTPLERFQADIQTSLGEKLKTIHPAEKLPATNGRIVYRVVAEGTAAELPMQWIYYLCASPSGKQLSLVFAVESQLLDALDSQDRKIVQSLRFDDSPSAPQR